MIFYRKNYDALLEWKKTNGKKAMLVEGARGTGKTMTVTEFAKKEYRSYILIDFSEKNETVRRLFYEYMNDYDTFFMCLSCEYGTKLYERDSVIIFDEVQNFPRARECIKFLVEDGRYDYIETGCLISIRDNTENILIPSEERSMKMHPLDFEEFCRALNDEIILDYIRKCFDEKVPLIDGLHKKAMLLFEQYMLVGGMPGAVAAFVDGRKDLDAADDKKREILKLYRDDIGKAPSTVRNKAERIFDMIPEFLSKRDRKIIQSAITGKSHAEKYDDTFFWLEESMMCNISCNCPDPKAGLFVNDGRTALKCYMVDTGLLVSHAFSKTELTQIGLYGAVLGGNLSANNGMFYENTVAQMLVSDGYPLYFHTHYDKEKHRNDIEIDFLISESGTLNQMISPIEVKSTTRYTTTSLNSFWEKYGKRIVRSIVIHPGDLKVDENTLYIPPYMTFCL